MEYYSALKRKKMLSHAIPWMNLEKITLRGKAWDLPDSPVLRLSLPVQGLGIRSLVRELGSHVPHCQKPKT